MLEGWRPFIRQRRLMVRRAVLVAVAGAAFLICSPWSPVLRAQRGAPPPAAQGDPNAPPPKSTALILGQVIDGTTRQPVGEAVVTLTGAGQRGAPQLNAINNAGLSPQQQQAVSYTHL